MKYAIVLSWIWLAIAAIVLIHYKDNIGGYVALAISQVWGTAHVIIGAINED